MSAHVELENFITPELVEESWRQAMIALENKNTGFADTGMRAARERDSKLLKALELAAEIVDKQTEQQYGRHMRSLNTRFAETRGTTEQQMWREAYRLCEEGNPIFQLRWIYGAAAWLVGYNR